MVCRMAMTERVLAELVSYVATSPHGRHAPGRKCMSGRGQERRCQLKISTIYQKLASVRHGGAIWLERIVGSEGQE